MKRSQQQQQEEYEKIVTFLHGLKPNLRMFMQDVYPVPRTLKEVIEQASEATQILYAEGSSSSSEDQESFDECESDSSTASEASVDCHHSSSSEDSEAVTMSDFVSEDDELMTEEESCVESDYVESQTESDPDQAVEEVCDNCGAEISSNSTTNVARRFKCYGCHATGHKVKDCPMMEIKCKN